MYRIIKNIDKLQRNLCVCVAGMGLSLLCLSSCSDDWDDHYQANSTSEGTLWDALSSDADLSNFASVVKATGYDRALNGSQTYSLFVPTNSCLTAVQTDSLIQLYQTQKAAGVKDNDNTVIRQFLQNHISLFTHSVSSLTNDSITMLNGKYDILTANSIAGKTLASAGKLYSNGMLYTVSDKIDYFPNVYEYMGLDNDLDSAYQFLRRYNVYEFNESQSVAGGIVDGQTVYLDSVTRLQNDIFDLIGKIDNEDSTYLMVAPVNSEWDRLLNEYKNYFVYDNTVDHRDSLQYANPRLAILAGGVFSRSKNPETALRDSAVSTMASSYTVRRLLYGDNDYYIYYNPFASGGVFDGTTAIECSNGQMMKASTFNIDKRQTFLQEIKVEAENLTSQDTIMDAETPLVVRQVTADNSFYDKISDNSYVDVVPYLSKESQSRNPVPTVRFSIPNTLSNVGYDVYVVFAPVIAYNPSASAEDRLPNRVRPFIDYLDANGKDQMKRCDIVETTPDVVDTVLVASNITFPVCGTGLAEPVVKLRLISQVNSNMTSRYSNTMHLDCIIFKPHTDE